MFLADDVLLSPVKGLFWIFREIYEAAIAETRSEGERIRHELSQLYIALESGSVSEAEFDDRERELLDRLDQIELGTEAEEEGDEPIDDAEEPINDDEVQET